VSTSTSTTDPTSPAGATARSWGGVNTRGKLSSRLAGGARRRSVPYLLLGVLLVVVCAGGGVLAGLQLGNRETVLALSRPVTVGQLLSTKDLRQVSMSADSGLDMVAASAASTVVGQPVAFNLPAGSLVTRAILGSPQVPAQGKAIAAVGLKPGQFPPDLAPGTTVAVLTTPAATVTSGATILPSSSWTAVVTGVAPQANDQTTVVSLQLSDSDARALASAPAGQLSVVTISGGGH
jgi:hypothetical protein